MQDYYSADQQIHWLSQLLAKINRTFLEKKSDDSHTNLYFDALNKRLYGRWLESSNGKHLISLNLTDLSLELHDQYLNSVWLINCQGKSVLEVESQLDNGLNELGFEDNDWKEHMHYEIPDYGLNKGPIERLSESQINLWCRFRALANHACMDLLGSCQAESEIRIWPHHFDTGIYFKVGEELEIGFGLAMKDSLANEAYFYLTANADSLDFDYSTFSSGNSWEWKSDDWKGALFKLSTLEAMDQEEALNRINDFSAMALEQFCSALA
jgi:hypothetical protein